MQVSENVRAVQVPDGNPMHPVFTSIYLVGKGQCLTIDSGEDMERYRWMLRGYLAATQRAEIAQSAVTHFHADHSANLRWLRDEFKTEVHVMEVGVPFMRERLPDGGLHMMDDGDVIDAGGVKLNVLHTPGHSVDSVCFYIEDEGVLLSGDTLLGSSTTTVHDLAAYMASLRRLVQLPNLKVICPGHGPLMSEPHAYINDYIQHREQREQQIIDQLATGGAKTSWQIMEGIYTNLNPRLRRAADGNVRSHLVKLEQEGRVKLHPGKPRDVSAQERAEAEAQQREHDDILRRAEELRLQQARRAVFLQENPPENEWLEPPRFELS